MIYYNPKHAELGFPTRLYRAAEDGGVEWIYAFDYACGDQHWMESGVWDSIPQMIDNGYVLPYVEEGE